MPSVARAAAVRFNLGLVAVREKIANSFAGTLSRRTRFTSGRGFVGHVDDITLVFLSALVLQLAKLGSMALHLLLAVN
jgi:hypothetical protein